MAVAPHHLACMSAPSVQISPGEMPPALLSPQSISQATLKPACLTVTGSSATRKIRREGKMSTHELFVDSSPNSKEDNTKIKRHAGGILEGRSGACPHLSCDVE